MKFSLINHLFILWGVVGLLLSSCRPAIGENAESPIAEDSIASTYMLDIVIDSLSPEHHHVKSGDNLGAILTRFDISAAKIDSLRLKAEGVFDVTKLRIGNRYTVLRDLQTGFAEYMVYERSLRHHVVFNLRDSMGVYMYDKEITYREERTAGTITSSLWNSIREGGNDIALSDMMSEIYAWQIDFFGIAKGDNFRVLYEQAYIDDSIKLDINRIIGAVFSHHGKEYYAIPYQQDSIVEFFDENGQSIRKAFLKAPLKFSRITSGFSNARKHPVLKIVRPHHGVDYAAPVGTPVRSVGAGSVTTKAYQAGGAGYYVKVRHNGGYETTYMHLSKFAPGLEKGKRVAQGEVIGYVGSTGTSTGPHLDFRVHLNGKPINPLKMESPPSLPIRPEHIDTFKAVKQEIIDRLIAIPY